MLDGKSVLVTGGTGSFGREFVATVLKRYRPRRLIVFSRDELKQSEMARDCSPTEHSCLRYFVGDVREPSGFETSLDRDERATSLHPLLRFQPTSSRRASVCRGRSQAMVP